MKRETIHTKEVTIVRHSSKYQEQMEGEGIISREFSRKGTCVQERSVPPSGDDTSIYQWPVH